MTTAQNKQLMEEIFEELSKGNSKPFGEAMADDFCWTIIGTTKWSGTYRGKESVLEDLMVPLFAQFAGQYTNTADRIIAEGDHVVIECRGRVTTEYLDTELVTAALSGPGAVPA